jgi:hypothetical protein
MKLSVGGTTLHLTRGRVVVLLVAFALLGFGGYDYVEQRETVEDAEAVDAIVRQLNGCREHRRARY